MKVSNAKPVRFQGLMFDLGLTVGKGVAMATAYIGDYAQQGYADGVILAKKPSGEIKVLEADNPHVNSFTRHLRTNLKAFSPDTPAAISGSRFHLGVAHLWQAVKLKFVANEWPQTQSHKEGPAFYQELFEKPYVEGTVAAECAFTSALGHKYAVLIPSRDNRNDRFVFLDKASAKLLEPRPPVVAEALT